MRRWNEYYDRMTPKKSSIKLNHGNFTSATKERKSPVQNFSVFPRQLKQRNSLATNSVHSNETSFRTDRYVSRRDDPSTISSRVDSKHNDSNFAWVD